MNRSTWSTATFSTYFRLTRCRRAPASPGGLSGRRNTFVSCRASTRAMAPPPARRPPGHGGEVRSLGTSRGGGQTNKPSAELARHVGGGGQQHQHGHGGVGPEAVAAALVLLHHAGGRERLQVVVELPGRPQPGGFLECRPRLRP